MKINTRKRGEYWEYRFEGAPIDGKRKQYSKSGFKTKKEALEAGTKALAEYNHSGLKFEPTTVSVADYLDYYYENYVKVNHKYSTQYGYAFIIENHLKPALGKYRLVSLTPAICQEFVNSLAKRNLAKNTVTDICGCLSAALKYAVTPLEYIPASPMIYVKPTKHLRAARERVILTQEEYQSIMKEFPEGNRYYVPFQIGYFTGVRAGEVCALTWNDIDLDNCTITINKQLTCRPIDLNIKVFTETRRKQQNGKQDKTSWYFGTPKTTKSNRVIKFGKTLQEILIREKKRQEDNEKNYGEYFTCYYEKPEIDEKGHTIIRVLPALKGVSSSLKRIHLVCIDENGIITSPNSFRYPTRVIRDKLNIRFEYHSLRHTHATMLIEGGANVKAVQERLGHQNIETTLQTYVHNTEDMANDAVDIFEKLQ